MTFFSQARRTCGTTHFIRPCTILHATGFGLPPNFEDWNDIKTKQDLIHAVQDIWHKLPLHYIQSISKYSNPIESRCEGKFLRNPNLNEISRRVASSSLEL